MALVLADRVKVTTTTTGTGAVALGAAQAGYQDFSVLSDGDTTYYCIVDNATGAWEVGLGTYASAGPSLARTSVIASSTGTAVSFGAGPKDVFITLPAERVVTTDGADFSGPVTVPAGATGNQVPRSSEVVHMTGDETIAGVKTFSSSPIVPAGATGAQAIRAEEVAMTPLTFPVVGASAVDITSLPSGINEFSIVFSNIAVAGGAQVWIRLGTSDGVSSTNYAAIQACALPATAPAIGEVATHIPVRSDGSNASTVRGYVTFRRATVNNWLANGIMYRNDDKAIIWVVGLCGLPGVLDRIRLMTSNASNFTGGAFDITWRR